MNVPLAVKLHAQNMVVWCKTVAFCAAFRLKQIICDFIYVSNVLFVWCVVASCFCLSVFINLLKPTGYVMHQQFNIQQLYALPTLYLCVLYLSENKQRLVPLTA